MGALQSRSKSPEAVDAENNYGGYDPDMHRLALIPRFGTPALRLILDFAEAHSTLMVFRTLSSADKEAVERRLKFIALDHIVLRVPGELLANQDNKFCVRTYLGEEIEFFHQDKQEAIVIETAWYLYQNLPRDSMARRVQQYPSIHHAWLRADEIRKATEILEPLYKKLHVYTETLRIDITELTIIDPNCVISCHAIGEHVAKLLADLQHLRRVNCKEVNTSFLEQMKKECSQLVSAGGLVDR
jgi:hypothetical protein